MKFSFDWIRELSETSLTASEAAALLSAKSFEAVATDDVLDIDVLPNRPDCLSHLGVARDLCALEGREFSAPAYEYHAGKHPAAPIALEDTEGCIRFTAAVMKGVRVGPSPDWMVQRLEVCGLRSINNVVDVTNYVMLELGQPMHSYDLKLVDRVVVRRAHEGETIHALDEERTRYALDASMTVVADGTKPLAIAGIKGGADSGISDATTEVLLEAACWQPETVRATSRKLELRTDASIRFSYGTDPNLTAPALMRAAELLEKVAGARMDGALIDEYPTRRTPQEMVLNGDAIRTLLGNDVPDVRIREIVASLGFQVHERDGRAVVQVPTRRLDITGPDDLAEEVGRVIGYDAIPSAPPLLPVYDERSWVREDADRVWDEYGFVRERSALTHLLAGAGDSEGYNYSFISDDLRELFRAAGPELAQPQSAEYRWLRTSLVPRLLINARDNLRFFDSVKLFETGHVFDHVGEGKESARLGLILADRAGSAEPFYELKGAIDLLLRRAGITDAVFDDAEPMTWDKGAVHASAKGRRALIRLEGSEAIIGFIGAVSGRVADALKLKGSTAVAELDLRALVVHAQGEREFQPLPKYPSVVRDIAVYVDQGVKVDDIIQTVHDADLNGLVRDVDVFDIFLPTGGEKLKAEGDLPEYGKSVAFHVVLRADDYTLTDREADAVQTAISAALQEKLDARIR